MIKKEIKVNLEHGLHIRPAKEFVQVATKFHSDIDVIKNSQTANGKSILGIVSLGILKGETITLKADGSDENEAITSLEKIFIEGEA
ncbi:HPr family phosphocarrier protein [Shimazuella sp. AN120528]|uniref:HPr family phosphocarrier protein n=1 Tax=Shimazuella soli TaxID=1892854 RepID=UPI001F0FA2C8|nr:HPr family phosphocarrier protein [Shimazuella soli]MCH5584909.1 HPr family phosphocarrier protein [Shimazuella soli]